VTAFGLVSCALNLFGALVWAVMARQIWEFVVVERPKSRLFRMAPVFMSVVAFHLVAHAAWRLVPDEVAHGTEGPVVWLRILAEVSGAVSFLMGFHMLQLMPLPERPASRWLTPLYVWTSCAMVTAAVLRLAPDVGPAARAGADALVGGTIALLAGLCIVSGIRLARPGAWGPESAAEVRRPDVIVIAAGVVVSVVAALVCLALGQRDLGGVVLTVGLGLAIAVPWTMRMLGVVVPELIVSVTLGLAMLGIVGGAVVARPHVETSFRPVFDLGAFLLLAFAVVPGQRWLRVRVDRLVLGRSRREVAELRAFLQTLSPEVGVAECCRRALAELVRVRRLDGAAVILRDGEAIVHGRFDLALLRVWPRGAAADALPSGSYGTAQLRELPLALREGLVRANVGLGTSAIATPRRRWGHLFMSTGLLHGTFREDDATDFRAFVSQLALQLDAADLLARALVVERSLAHAEKLAAIGETAARIAHEIRNPVTAARSLAQQLAREPGAPFAAELGVILEELERVERQVAALLRFARREELRREAVDLGELLRTTVDRFRPRLEAAGVEVTLTAPEVVAHVDREKLRQVLVNLIENALDALADAPGARRLAVAVEGHNGTAAVRVSDTGPGVAPDALPRLFEPFFSLKSTGTGLGLAIAKRTVDAHGGRISAVADAPGMTFAVELPLAGDR
jgi:signal transduction histidine kinase